MKILVIAPQPFFTIRGTPLAIRELVGIFIKLGHSVDILTFHLGEDITLPGLNIYRNKIFSKRIKSIPPGFSFRKLILDLVLLPKALFMILKNNYNIAHCVEESAYFIAWFRWLKPFLFTYDMDSDIPKQLVESGKVKNWFLLRLIKEIEKIALKKSDAVVTICPVFTSKARRLFPQKRVFQIEDISISDQITSEKASTMRKVILYTGNFQKYQGVELLIEGFRRIEKNWPAAELVLIGGEESQVGALQKRHKDRQIIFTGKRPLSEIPRFLGNADILVSPRLVGENTPFKIYSYLASGKPILATDIISHTQVLINEKNALLIKPTTEGMAGGLQRLLGEQELAHRLADGARELFEKNYTKACYEGKVKGYMEFMEEIWEKTK